MGISPNVIASLNEGKVKSLSNDQMLEALRSILQVETDDRKENQILYYKPASEKAGEIHKLNMERFDAKKALQAEFFKEQYGERKNNVQGQC